MIKYSELVRNRGKYIEYMDRRKYRIREELIYWIDYEHKNEYIRIPKWYIFDFNSSPCFAHCIVDRDQFVISLIHDMLYSREWEVYVIDRKNLSEKFKKIEKNWYGYTFWKEEWEKMVQSFLYNRRFADKIWLWGAIEESREIERVDRTKQAYIGYLGLRIWGWKNFKK